MGGVHPQLVVEQNAEALVGGEGVGSTTRPVQGQHELLPAPFAQGFVGRQHLQLRHQHLVVAQGEVGVDPQLQGDGAQLVEPGHLTEPERPLGQVDQGRSPPPCEGLLEQADGPAGVVTLEGLAPRRHQPLEPVRVHRLGIDAEAVAGRLGGDELSRQGVT